jgi:hypothetical protein
MHTGMKLSMRCQIITQDPKITVLWATGAVRPALEISQIFNTICAHLLMGFLSTNVLVSNDPLRIAPCSHVDQWLTTT